MKIIVLLENHTVHNKYKSKHGLSLLINYDNNNILLDVGPDNTFIKNAKENNIDLTKINYLFLSHSHNDHTGGINDFNIINNNAQIYLMDTIFNKYYVKALFLKYSIGLKLNKKFYSRINQLRDDLNINDKVFFLKNIVSKNKNHILIRICIKKMEIKLRVILLITKVY